MIKLSLRLLFVAALVTFLSCDDKVDINLPMECPEEALHTLGKATGKMVYLPCYGAWAVELDKSLHEDGGTMAASLDMDEAYKVDSMQVVVDACLYEFDLPLLLPDPGIWGYLYNLENFSVSQE